MAAACTAKRAKAVCAGADSVQLGEHVEQRRRCGEQNHEADARQRAVRRRARRG